MAVATTTTLSNVIRSVYNPRITDLTFQNDYLVQLPGAPEGSGDSAEKPRGLFPIVSSKGGTAWTWPVKSASGAAAAYTEGAAYPAAGNNTWLQATIAFSTGYYARTVEITGHSIDALRDEGAIVEALDKELESAFLAMSDAYNVYALGTANWGLGLAIDASGTYAGLNRATYTTFVSHETALGGAMSKAALRDEVEALMDNDRGVRKQDLAILCPVNQLSNYMALGGAGAGTPHVSIGGQTFDLGYADASFEGIQMYGIPDMTDTELFFVHKPSTYWVMHKAPALELVPTSAYTTAWALVCSMILVVENPQFCAKVTGITA